MKEMEKLLQLIKELAVETETKRMAWVLIGILAIYAISALLGTIAPKGLI